MSLRVLLAARVPYLCACGTVHPVDRTLALEGPSWDAVRAHVAASGTVSGTCPSCGEPARGCMPVWALVAGRLTRLVSADHAAAPVEPARLKAVLEAVADRGDVVVEPAAVRLDAPATGRRRAAPADEAESTRVRPAPRSGDGGQEPEEEGPLADLAEESETVRSDAGLGSYDTVVVDSGPVEVQTGAAVRAEIVARAGDGLGAHLGDLREIDGRVRVVVRGALAERWREAELTAYPVHLRSYGYPLYGLRIVGRSAGQVGCIDAVVDPAESVATEVARVLSQHVRFELVILGGGEYRCDVEAPGFERNAVLCLESAQAWLATDGLPPSKFGRAVEALARAGAEERLVDAAPPIELRRNDPIDSARAAFDALARLDRAARPENSSRLLEAAGVPYVAFDAWRRTVLEKATEFGIAAPRRFWRRMTAAGIVPDLATYVADLARNRARLVETGACDLTDTERVEAWQRIWDLCERKAIEPPPELRAALGLEAHGDEPRSPTGDTTAGVIAKREDTHARWRRRLQDPQERLAAIAEALAASSIDDRTLSEVLEQLDVLAPDELLAVLPELPRLGKRVVPGLVARLRSTRREVRQGAAIALGAIGGTEAIAALVDYLLTERTRAWMDAARALGAHGAEALDVLAQRIRRTRAKKDLDRLVRALAEIAVADAGVCERLERLARDAERDAVSRLARAALAQRSTVREEGRKIRGEAPLSEVTVIRGFSRRVHEALFVPELDLDDAVTLDS